MTRSHPISSRRLRRGLALFTGVVLAAGAIVLDAPPGRATGGWHVFPGTGFGPIPDAVACAPSPGTPLNVTFNVVGVAQGALADVRVTGLTMSHGWAGDVVARLIAPNGASQVLFGRTGAVAPAGGGDDSNLAGPYTFTDHATPSHGGWWEAAGAVDSGTQVPAGDYYATTIGGDPTSGAPVSLTGAFTGVSNPNGTWTLRFTDGCSGSVGSVSAATLEVRAASDICAREHADVTSAQTAVTAATGAVTAATSARAKADERLAAARNAVRKAKKAVRKATHALLVSHGGAAEAKAARALATAKARLARARTRLARAEGTVAVTGQALADAQAAAAVAAAHLADAVEDEAACRAE